MPTVYIGLGGTGTQFADKIAEALIGFHSKDWLENHNRFICLDTSTEDLSSFVNHIPPELLQTIRIGKRDVRRALDIWEDNETQEDIQDHFYNWYPSQDESDMNLSGFASGANGVRLGGRFAFYYNASDVWSAIERAHNELSQVEATGKVESDDWDFVLSATLSNGTGGGCFLDVANLIWRYFIKKGLNDPRIHGLFLAGDVAAHFDQGAPEQTRVWRENGVQALVELDWWLRKPSFRSSRGAKPGYNLTYLGSIHKDARVDQTNNHKGDLFTSISLISEKNGKGDFLGEYPAYVAIGAEAMAALNGFHKVRAVDAYSKIQEMEKDGSSKRFGTIGCATLEFPRADYQLYLSQMVAKNALKKSFVLPSEERQSVIEAAKNDFRAKQLHTDYDKGDKRSKASQDVGLLKRIYEPTSVQEIFKRARNVVGGLRSGSSAGAMSAQANRVETVLNESIRSLNSIVKEELNEHLDGVRKRILESIGVSIQDNGLGYTSLFLESMCNLVEGAEDAFRHLDKRIDEEGKKRGFSNKKDNVFNELERIEASWWPLGRKKRMKVARLGAVNSLNKEAQWDLRRGSYSECQRGLHELLKDLKAWSSKLERYKTELRSFERRLGGQDLGEEVPKQRLLLGGPVWTPSDSKYKEYLWKKLETSDAFHSLSKKFLQDTLRSIGRETFTVRHLESDVWDGQIADDQEALDAIIADLSREQEFDLEGIVPQTLDSAFEDYLDCHLKEYIESAKEGKTEQAKVNVDRCRNRDPMVFGEAVVRVLKEKATNARVQVSDVLEKVIKDTVNEVSRYATPWWSSEESFGLKDGYMRYLPEKNPLVANVMSKAQGQDGLKPDNTRGHIEPTVLRVTRRWMKSSLSKILPAKKFSDLWEDAFSRIPPVWSDKRYLGNSQHDNWKHDPWSGAVDSKKNKAFFAIAFLHERGFLETIRPKGGVFKIKVLKDFPNRMLKVGISLGTWDATIEKFCRTNEDSRDFYLGVSHQLTLLKTPQDGSGVVSQSAVLEELRTVFKGTMDILYEIEKQSTSSPKQWKERRGKLASITEPSGEAKLKNILQLLKTL